MRTGVSAKTQRSTMPSASSSFSRSESMRSLRPGTASVRSLNRVTPPSMHADDCAGPPAADQLHGVVVAGAEAPMVGVRVSIACIITQSKPLDKC